MSVTTIPDVEAIVGNYLRGHADIVALNARVSGQLPNTFVKPWIRVTMIDAADAALSSNANEEHFTSFLCQCDCYAGSEIDNAQAQASTLGRTVRAVLVAAKGQTLGSAVITGVEIRNHARLDDLDFDPPRSRHVLTVEIWAHPA